MRCPELLRLAAGVIACAAFVPAVSAYTLSGQRWPAGQVTMHLQLGSTSGPLIDGSASWGAVAEEALFAWNRAVTNLRYVTVRDSTAAITRGNNLNNVVFSSSVYGAAWDSRTLGITLTTYDTRTRRLSEADVLFNATVKWDSYRGPVRTVSPGVNLNDFRRVALHEFGHALGLTHPDLAGQSVAAIMNSNTGDLDALTDDDMTGVRSIYDNPATPPSSILSLQGSIGYSTVGSSLTLRVGSIRNDGDAISGTLRLELWASPQSYVDALPAGAQLLGARTLDGTLAASATLADIAATTSYAIPANGSYYVVLLLLESSGTTFTVRDSVEMSGFLNVGPPQTPVITAQPASLAAAVGSVVTFSVAAAGAQPLSYQWSKDGTAIAGATKPSFTLANVQSAHAGAYSVVVTNTVGTARSAPASLIFGNAANPGRLVNMSIRTTAGTGDNTLIVGVGMGGAGTSGSKAALFRAVGPTLGAFGVSGALADTVMTVFQDQVQVAQNDDWAGGFDFNAVGAFGLVGTPPRDAAIYSGALPRGGYSIQVDGKGGATGVVLAEIYDATPSSAFGATTPRLVNVSARTQVGTGDAVLIAGFVVGGTTPVRVLVRAAGPTLGAFGVGGTLVDPRLSLASPTVTLGENDNWGGTAELKAAFAAVGAFPFSADNSRDAALIATLVPGSYTAQISGVNNTTGVALVEVYELP